MNEKKCNKYLKNLKIKQYLLMRENFFVGARLEWRTTISLLTTMEHAKRIIGWKKTNIVLTAVRDFPIHAANRIFNFIELENCLIVLLIMFFFVRLVQKRGCENVTSKIFLFFLSLWEACIYTQPSTPACDLWWLLL